MVSVPCQLACVSGPTTGLVRAFQDEATVPVPPSREERALFIRAIHV